MAINQTEIALDACKEVVNRATQITEALDALEAVQEQLTAADIDLADYTVAIEASGDTQHCDAATYKNILGYFAADIVAHAQAYYSGTPTQQEWVALQKARR
jgi:hypothetical protein